VAANGLYILLTTLFLQVTTHRGSRLTDIQVDLPLLIGLSLIYLSTLLRRRKRTAWVVTIVAYGFYFGVGIEQLIDKSFGRSATWHEIFRTIIMPLLMVTLLILLRKQFVVKSDIRAFRSSVVFSIVIILVALIYGIVGFTLMDKRDFHQEIGPISAAHYTVDQFNITTIKPVKAYSKRAQLFLDSLTFVSAAAVIYALISLFQPIKLRFSDQRVDREKMLEIMMRYGAQSEEYFKIWPHDKQYFFDDSEQAGIAFHVYRGVALVLSDPVGDKKKYESLMTSFDELCFSNDWLPAFIHVADTHKKLYEKHGYNLQKLGQEAILNLLHFDQNVKGTKYFRQINNKFTKQGYSSEVLFPPHHKAVLDRLSVVSSDWLKRGSRAERGFVMGYYTEEYAQQCPILVARDAAGTIQGFVNLVPADFDKKEATYDLLRHADGSLGNINDFVLMRLIDYLSEEGYTRLNLGLCPLAGLDESNDDDKNLLDSVLKFAYANGDRFYSFSGLHKFKAKYEPEWHDRYLAYQRGVRGSSRSLTALTRTMRKVVKQ